MTGAVCVEARGTMLQMIIGTEFQWQSTRVISEEQYYTNMNIDNPLTLSPQLEFAPEGSLKAIALLAHV